MKSSKILFEASYTVCTRCDINSCERKKVVIHDVAHSDLILQVLTLPSVDRHTISLTLETNKLFETIQE